MNALRYIRVLWIHDFPDEPVELFSELNEERRQLRAIEVFRGGQRGYAWSEGSKGSTQLSIEPIPSLEEIAAQSQFVPQEISKEEFDEEWMKATHS